MNSVNSMFATSKLTVWRGTKNVDHQMTWSRVGSFACSYSGGRKMVRDADGRKFMPSSVYYPSGVIDVQRDDAIAVGDIAGDTPSGVERVRAIHEHDESFFGRGNSMVIYAG